MGVAGFGTQLGDPSRIESSAEQVTPFAPNHDHSNTQVLTVKSHTVRIAYLELRNVNRVMTMI